MEKKVIYQAFAVGLVLIFVVEMVAMGYLNSNNSGNGGDTTIGVSMEGSVLANVTINRYEPYVIVKGGNASDIEAVFARLKESGAMTYSTASADGTIVSLKSSANAPEAARAFQDIGATVTATAYVGMPALVKVKGGGITTDAEGTSFKTTLKPIYPEGSRQEASFDVIVEDGRVVALGNFMILPKSVKGVVVAANVTSSSTSYNVEVVWEDRVSAKQIARAGNATYKEKSYIDVPAETGFQALSALGNFPYATGVQQGRVSVQNGFADRGTATIDFLSLNVTPTFPRSVASFQNATSNESALLLIGALSDAGIESYFGQETVLGLKLPEKVTVGKETYILGSPEVYLTASAAQANQTQVRLTMDFVVEGNTVSTVSGASLEVGEPSE